MSISWHQIYPKKRNGWGMGKSEHIECIWATMVEGVWFGEGKNWGSNLQT